VGRGIWRGSQLPTNRQIKRLCYRLCWRPVSKKKYGENGPYMNRVSCPKRNGPSLWTGATSVLHFDTILSLPKRTEGSEGVG
jgi:hypothetical protein